MELEIFNLDPNYKLDLEGLINFVIKTHPRLKEGSKAQLNEWKAYFLENAKGHKFEEMSVKEFISFFDPSCKNYA